jgi:hypothetical protein
MLSHLGHWYEPIGFAGPVLALVVWLVVQTARARGDD